MTVQPSASHPDILSVQDAMRQVLDFFELLTPEGEEGASLVWNLQLASTNSPLTVVGEATSLTREVDVTVIARQQKSLVEDSLRALREGRSPSHLSKRRRTALRRLFVRNMNGIGKTEAVLARDEKPEIVTPATAKQAIALLDKDESEFNSLVLPDRARVEFGSIEGILLDVGTDYNQPAILVRNRRTGESIWCRVSLEQAHKISEEARFEDVWNRRRVLVKGRVRYNERGEIIRVYAEAIQTLKPRQMTLHDIADGDFTSGLSNAEYLSSLREGELGS